MATRLPFEFGNGLSSPGESSRCEAHPTLGYGADRIILPARTRTRWVSSTLRRNSQVTGTTSSESDFAVRH